MKGARSHSGSCWNTSKAQFHPFSASAGAKTMLARESDASCVSVVEIDVEAKGRDVMPEIGPMRIRHAGEKSS